MIEQDTNKLIKEQLAKLPLNLREAIAAMPWKALAQQIGKENNLSTGQIESLEQETMLIIYAFEPIQNYISNITKEVGIQEEVANAIANAVAEKILDPISQKADGAASENKTPEPVIITQETKEEAMKRMERRGQPIEEKPNVPPSFAQGSVRAMEIKPDIHPMVEPGPAVAQGYGEAREMVHEVPHTEPTADHQPPTNIDSKPKPSVPIPDYRYPKGKDPYRESTD